jgi:hypothetical protein
MAYFSPTPVARRLAIGVSPAVGDLGQSATLTPSTTLFFTAGGHDGAHGWYGRIDFSGAQQVDAAIRQQPIDPHESDNRLTRPNGGAPARQRHGDPVAPLGST